MWGSHTNTHIHTHISVCLVPFHLFTGFLTVRWATAAVWWLVSGEWNSLFECQRASEIEREWERKRERGREGGHLNGEKDSEVISCSSYVLNVERCWRKDRKIVFFFMFWKQKKWKEKKDPLDSADWHLETYCKISPLWMLLVLGLYLEACSRRSCSNFCFWFVFGLCDVYHSLVELADIF